ncbi:unnamed protein product [Tuber aestivum]|uniref:Uncharacterized protein n=1 Tax=Tuber aestivum TaxID=59557 RepID=A0A292PU35_9PEZI|nr:unnamed protein product [Tuber aestivum]
MSAPNITEIPGFYYGMHRSVYTGKRKYFRILSDHAIASSSSSSRSSGRPNFYTPSTIAELEAKKLKLNDDARQESSSFRYRRRSSLFASPSTRWNLEREMSVGTPVSLRAAYKRHAAKYWVYKEFIPAANVVQGVSNLFVQRMGGTVYFVVGMNSGNITSFCANGVGAKGVGLGSSIEGFKDREFWKSEMEQGMQLEGEVRERELVRSDVSVRYWYFRLPGMVTGTVAIENEGSNLEVLRDIQRVSSLSATFARQILGKTADFFPTMYGPAGTYPVRTDVPDQKPTLSMTYSPDKRTMFYGLEKGVAFGRADRQAGVRGPVTNLGTDIFAVHCLPPDAPTHTGFLAGGRDGTVRLFDVRANPRTRAPIILNVGSVRHIGGLGPVKLAIRCVDSCAVYDLRMQQHLRRPGAESPCISRFRVPDTDGRKGGFDVYHEMGLIAVEGGGVGTGSGGSSSSNEKAVYLFDVDSADLVKKFPPGQVKFLKPEGGDGWPTVVIAGEHGVGVHQ